MKVLHEIILDAPINLRKKKSEKAFDSFVRLQSKNLDLPFPAVELPANQNDINPDTGHPLPLPHVRVANGVRIDVVDPPHLFEEKALSSETSYFLDSATFDNCPGILDYSDKI